MSYKVGHIRSMAGAVAYATRGGQGQVHWCVGCFVLSQVGHGTALNGTLRVCCCAPRSAWGRVPHGAMVRSCRICHVRVGRGKLGHNTYLCITSRYAGIKWVCIAHSSMVGPWLPKGFSGPRAARAVVTCTKVTPLLCTPSAMLFILANTLRRSLSVVGLLLLAAEVVTGCHSQWDMLRHTVKHF